jgi:hypothetical protein
MNSSDKGFRVAFIVYVVILAVAMPLMSFDHGTTWDELYSHNYGEHLLDFYGSLGEDDEALSYGNLYLYGGLFEMVAEIAVAVINPITEGRYTYEIRHVVNCLFGLLAILFTGLLARQLGGWPCAVTALLMISLAPRFLGHSMNNPKDIPFAAFYSMALYFIGKVINAFPRPSKRDTGWLIVAIAGAINVRAGGLLLICYFGLFLGLVVAYRCYTNWRLSLTNARYWLKMGLYYGLLVGISAYLAGVICWPYGLVNPIVHPVETVLTISDFPNVIAVWFDGQQIDSDSLPWYYYPQSLAITTPLVMLLGLLAGLVYAAGLGFRTFNGTVGMVVFAFAFPVAYILLSESNVYDVIRQVLFIYPPMAVLSSLGLVRLFHVLRGRLLQTAYVAAVIGLFAMPVTHIVQSYPNEYVFYNALTGGVEGAYGAYELDYWGNASKPLRRKLGAHLERTAHPDSTVVVRKNFTSPGEYILERSHKPIEYGGISVNLPEDKEYDYAILIARWFPLAYFDNGMWPPGNTLFKETVDGVPIAVVVENQMHATRSDPKP